ncbi:hypothetical protein NQ317_000619 [Molorchus minor]|uniref:Sucrose-6-phosphate hydrolase n=1 Tax=Molorchus minor TaxID=1323400 RepID=A0ABQ9IVC2_9CUCU|nr:hypothetical protein NQ317_000619 [Molorchus minor]
MAEHIYPVILALFMSYLLCALAYKDSEYTVQRANEYIEENKYSVDKTYRPHYHLKAPIGWINDPNGFIQYQGEYHLFYQYNPYSTTANKIHWGHAKSKDLYHWEDLPVAMAPDHDYDSDGVFSGTTIEKDGKLYAMYTGNSPNGQVQCIAVSEDGITFDKIAENPVLKASDLPSNAQPQDFRDPKVFKKDDIYYVATVSKTINNTGQVLLYQSSDLIQWQFKSILLEGTEEQGIMWECPDLFELDGKDVLIISSIQMPAVGDDYRNTDTVLAFIGEIDWTSGEFHVESVKEIDHGLDFYASQSLLDDKGRRISVSWMNMWGRSYPTADLNQGWVGAMTLPREFHIENGYLVQKPISEIAVAYVYAAILHNVTLTDKTTVISGVAGETGQLEVIVDLSAANSFTIEIRAAKNEKTVLRYDVLTQELSLDRSQTGVNITGSENPPLFARQVKVPLGDNNLLSLQIFVDKSSVEVFANGGVETLTTTIYPTEELAQGIQFVAEGEAIIQNLTYCHIDLTI